MKNTPENKAKFFAQYWGQDCFKMDYSLQSRYVNSKQLEVLDEGSFLELKPLSQIIGEDAIEVSMMLVEWPDSVSKLSEIKVRKPIEGEHSKDVVVFEFRGSFDYVIRFRDADFYGWRGGNGYCFTMSNYSAAFDFLRSKGYALPYMGISVEQQIEYGWIKLK